MWFMQGEFIKGVSGESEGNEGLSGDRGKAGIEALSEELPLEPGMEEVGAGGGRQRCPLEYDRHAVRVQGQSV